jgi:Ca-activated chloride channel homolog
MARAGMGEPFIVTRPEDAGKQAEKFKVLIQTPVLTDVHINYGGFEAYDIEPPSIPDVFAQRPVIVFGKYKGDPSGEIKITGITGEKPYTCSVEIKKIKPDNCNSAIRYLWARHRVAVLADYKSLSPNDESIKEVTHLGLTYNLLTEYTSFVAIDSLKRTDGKETTTVKQPLPLPEGVSDYAVGNVAAKSMAIMQSVPAPGQGLLNQLTECKEKAASPVMLEKDEEVKSFKILLKDVVAPKGFSIEKLRKEIESLNEQVKSCLEKSKKEVSGLNGSLKLKIDVDKTGHVKKVRVDENSGKISEELKKCLTILFQTLTLPVSPNDSAYVLEIVYEIRMGE